MAGMDDVSTRLQMGNQLMAKLVDVITNLFPRHTGSFTLSAAASTAVTESACTSSSIVTLQPTSASAGSLAVYVVSGSGSFTVYTSSGAPAAGTETYSYAIFNPL